MLRLLRQRRFLSHCTQHKNKKSSGGSEYSSAGAVPYITAWQTTVNECIISDDREEITSIHVSLRHPRPVVACKFCRSGYLYINKYNHSFCFWPLGGCRNKLSQGMFLVQYSVSSFLFLVSTNCLAAENYATRAVRVNQNSKVAGCTMSWKSIFDWWYVSERSIAMSAFAAVQIVPDKQSCYVEMSGYKVFTPSNSVQTCRTY